MLLAAGRKMYALKQTKLLEENLPSIFDRYTEQARRAIYFGRLEANHRNAKFISVENLLLGLTWDKDSRVDRVAGLSFLEQEIRAILEMPSLPKMTVPYPRGVDTPLNDDAKRVLAYTVSEADLDKEFWIDTDHLLRGILHVPSDAASALNQKGHTLESLRTASVQDRRQCPSPSATRWGRLMVLMNRNRSILFIALFIVAVLAFVLFIRWMGPVS